MSVSGDTVVVGTPSTVLVAAAEVHTSSYDRRAARGPDNETEASGQGSSGDYFGASVSVSGDTIIVGMYGYDDDGNVTSEERSSLLGHRASGRTRLT